MLRLNTKIFLIVFAAMLSLVVSASFGIHKTKAANQVNVTAYVVDKNGQSLPDGEYDIRFAIYLRGREEMDPYPSNTDAGSRIWQENQKITIFGGVLSVYLGTVNPLPNNIDFNQNDYYLGVQIGTDSEMAPRKKLGSAFSSINSSFLQGRTVGTQAGNIPALDNKGGLDSAILDKITRVGTIGQGTWEGDVIANDYLETDFTGKTYEGLTIKTSGGNNTLTVSSNVTLDQNLSTSSTPTFAAINLTDGLPIASGGTNATSIGEAGGVAYSDGTAYAFTGAGTAGQYLVSTGSGAPTWQAIAGGGVGGIGLAGHMAYWSDANNLAYDTNGNFYWDATNNRLGIGTATPAQALDVAGAIRSSSQFISTVASGTAPMQVSSNTLVSNLNADYLDGQHAAAFLTGNQTITLSGDVTGSGTTSIATTIANNSVDGTDIALGSDAQGDIMYYNGTDWARLAAGVSGQFLATNGAGANPSWGIPSGAGDISSVGDCASGDCLDGTSDGGTYVNFYDAQGAGQLTIANLTAARTYTLPNATGTIITSGNLTDITATGTIASGTWNGGVIDETYGGTGMSAYAEGDLLYYNGGTLTRLAAGTNGQILGAVGGANVYPTWMDAPFVGSHNLLSLSHPDTTAASPLAGDLITGIDIGGGIRRWQRFAIGAANSILMTNGSGNGVIWNPQTSITQLGTITSGTWNGTDIDVAHGGTGLGTINQGGILYADADDSLAALEGAVGDDAEYLRFHWNGGSPYVAWEVASGSFTSFTLSGDSGADQTINDSNTLEISGGTNITSVASATDTITLNLDSTLTGTTWNGNTIGVGYGGTGITGTPTNGQLLIGNGTNYTLATLTDGAGINITEGSGTITIASTLGTSVDLTSEVTGTLPVTRGGTGATTLADGGILLGSGTGAVTPMGVLGDGSIVIGDGVTDPTTLAAFSSSTGTLYHEYGGLEANVSAYAGLLKISGGTTSYITDNSTNWDTAYSHSLDNTQAHSDYLINNGADTTSGRLTAAGFTTNIQNGLQFDPFDTGAGDTSEIRFMELSANGSNYVGFKAPDNILDVSGSVIWTLPAAEGSSDNVLTTDGSGNLSWSSVAGVGGMNSFTLSGDSGADQTINDSNTLEISGGTNITSVASATDTITLNLDSTLTGTTWNGNTIGVGYGGTGITGTPTNGQLLIGNGTNYTLATLTDGAGINITEGSGTITIASTLGTSVDLTSEVTGILPVENGGTGISTASLTGVPVISSGTWSVDTNALAVTHGGTGEISEANLENKIEGYIFDADAETISGAWTVSDDVALRFGTNNDLQIAYDETTDDRLEITDGSNLLGAFSDAGTVGNLYLTGGISTFDNSVTAGYGEFTGLCLGNGANCITSWGDAGALSGSGGVGTVAYWVSSNQLGGMAQLSTAMGGTGIDTSVSGGVPIITAGTWSVPATLGADLGGTGMDGSSAGSGTLLIGNGSGFSLATLTDGDGITITEGSGSITIDSDLGDSVDGTEIAIASQAQGDVLYYNGSAWTRLAAGSAGQYLEGGTTPSWDTPTGAGDVTDVGDCAGGACFDGTIDGGTYLSFYDPQGTGQLITGNLTEARVWTLPDATGTVALTSDLHSSSTVTDTTSIDMSITGQQISGVVLPAGVDHNSLANLTTGDYHTQYALLAGRSGGQTLIGGTASGDDLTLQTTSNVTKGSYILSDLASGLVLSTSGTLSVITDSSTNWDAGYTYRLTGVTDNATGLDFSLGSNNATLAVTSGYVIPTTTQESNWGSAYSHSTTTTNVHGLTFTGEGSGGGLDADTIDGHDTAYFQTAYTNLNSIGSLANGTGWLYNNGSGTFSYSTPTGLISGLTANYVPYATSATAIGDSGMYWDSVNARLGIGTITPGAALQIGTLTPANITTPDNSLMVSGDLEVGGSIFMGPMSFPADSGAIAWIDMPVSTSVAADTVESYTASLGGTNILTIYGEALGAVGGVDATRVGIGTTTPGNLLSIQQAGTATSNTNIFSITNSGNAASMTNTRASILFNQYYYSATTPALVDSGNITVGTEGDWTSTTSTQDAYMAFSTVLNGTMAEKMRIDSAGNVGIGTTAASQALELGASKWLSFEGATDDTNETVLQVTDPTADNVITFPNETGTVCTTGSVCAGYQAALSGGTNDYNTYWTGAGTLGSEQYVALTRGGTGATLAASNGGIVYSNASTLAILAGTATANQMLMSGSSTTPAWSTATYPATTTANQILYSSAANTIGGITTGNSGILVTSAGGVPSIATDIPTAVTIGSAYIYRASGTDVPVADGGTGVSSLTAYGLIFGGTTSTGAVQSLGTGTSGQVLTSQGAGALPTWSAISGSLFTHNTNFTYLTTTTDDFVLGSSSTTNAPLFFDVSASELDIYGTTNKIKLSYDGTNYSSLATASNGDLTIASSNTAEAALVVGNNGALDASIQFDEVTQDYYFGVDNTDHFLKMGLGTVVGTTPYFAMSTAGKIGLGGMVAPTAMLHMTGVAGTVSLEINSNETTAASNVLMIRSDVAGADDAVFRVQANGLAFADGAYTDTGADYAEYFKTKDTDLQPGEAVCIDSQNENAVVRCGRTGDSNIMGIVSSTPSVIGNARDGRENDPNYKVIGMIGQIIGNVSTENGEITIGDSLTAASTAGYMRKANAGESTVGIAMENFDGTKGQVHILISRRNQSLTVEKVEEAVEKNIVAMELEDQVDNLVSQASSNLNAQIENLSTTFSPAQKNIITAEIAAATDPIVAMQNRLQSQMDLIQEENKVIADFIANMDVASMLYDESLNLGSGLLEADGIVAGALTVKNENEENKTIGSNYIEPKDKDNDGKSYVIKTRAVTETATVFTSFQANPNAYSWVEKVKDPETKEYIGFKINLNSEVSSRVYFDWWIVEKDDRTKDSEIEASIEASTEASTETVPATTETTTETEPGL